MSQSLLGKLARLGHVAEEPEGQGDDESSGHA